MGVNKCTAFPYLGWFNTAKKLGRIFTGFLNVALGTAHFDNAVLSLLTITDRI